jgi:hypothetical protein
MTKKDTLIKVALSNKFLLQAANTAFDKSLKTNEGFFKRLLPGSKSNKYLKQGKKFLKAGLKNF